MLALGAAVGRSGGSRRRGTAVRADHEVSGFRFGDVGVDVRTFYIVRKFQVAVFFCGTAGLAGIFSSLGGDLMVTCRVGLEGGLDTLFNGLLGRFVHLPCPLFWAPRCRKPVCLLARAGCRLATRALAGPVPDAVFGVPLRRQPHLDFNGKGLEVVDVSRSRNQVEIGT